MAIAQASSQNTCRITTFGVNPFVLTHVFSAAGQVDKLVLKAELDFHTAVPAKGISRCHGLAFNSYYEYA